MQALLQLLPEHMTPSIQGALGVAVPLCQGHMAALATWRPMRTSSGSHHCHMLTVVAGLTVML